MLKALELIGFKSFADRTRFEFPSGITVVVGPNGSGKSNVVDAIKWVLGEQSVKSLRGKEMVDVIFNGSSGRRPLNSAETTLTFDNSDGRLRLDTPEVHVTRRVYRSGEGEYLINRQPCRLRDIRDLFAGTGIATEAYSVIEQGKVDVMLQASAKDRRAIFEEAAGINRFKAKKIEALRRLERVEQNLLRLSDIVDEVENRLKSVRAQATKARRYKEYADRLQELRTQVGLADWRALGAKLDAIDAEANLLRQQIATETTAAEVAELKAAQWETQSAAIDSEIHSAEARLAENRQRVTALETTVEQERTARQRFGRSGRAAPQATAGPLQSRRRPGRSLESHPSRRPIRRNQASRTRQSTGRSATRTHRIDGPTRSNPRRKRTATLLAPGAIAHQRRPGQRNQHAGRARFPHRRGPRTLPNPPGRIASRSRANRARAGHRYPAPTRIGRTAGRTRRRLGHAARRTRRVAPAVGATPEGTCRLARTHQRRYRTAPPCWKISKSATKVSGPAPRKSSGKPAKTPRGPSNKSADCWPTSCR